MANHKSIEKWLKKYTIKELIKMCQVATWPLPKQTIGMHYNLFKLKPALCVIQKTLLITRLAIIFKAHFNYAY